MQLMHRESLLITEKLSRLSYRPFPSTVHPMHDSENESHWLCMSHLDLSRIFVYFLSFIQHMSDQYESFEGRFL